MKEVSIKLRIRKLNFSVNYVAYRYDLFNNNQVNCLIEQFINWRVPATCNFQLNPWHVQRRRNTQNILEREGRKREKLILSHHYRNASLAALVHFNNTRRELILMISKWLRSFVRSDQVSSYPRYSSRKKRTLMTSIFKTRFLGTL